MQTSQHRSRVGAERRHRTRVRLIESALEVFAAKGVDATVIEDVIASAGVSRIVGIRSCEYLIRPL